MKKLYILAISMIAFSTISLAQRDVKAVLVTPTSASTVAPGTINIEFNIVNDGPDPINGGDTIWLGYSNGTSQYSFNGTLNAVDGIILPAAASVPAGQSIPWAAIEAVLGPLTVNVTGSANICALVVGVGFTALTATGDANDPNLANNFDCFNVSLALSNEEITSTDVNAIEVYESNNSLYVTTQDVKDTRISITNMMGQTVENYTHTSAFDVYNLNHLPAGIYLVNIINVEGKTTTQKIVLR